MPHTQTGTLSAADTVANEVTSTHAHRWRIAEQGSPVSAARCSCGETRDFANGWAESSGSWLATRVPPAAGAH